MDLEYSQYKSLGSIDETVYRDPYFLEGEDGTYMKMRDNLTLNWEMSVLSRGYWKNRIHMDTDYSPQPRHVGWEWEVGARLPWGMDLFQHHHSRHGMEYRHPQGLRFPVEDSYGIRLRLIERGGK